jgi:outer membrane biosynthesis protein TonB
VSLQGSIETFALPDVLVLLSSTKKTGELRVVSGTTDGRLYVRDGKLVHSVVGNRDAQLVDAVFELLRLDTGTFSFGDKAAPKEVGSEPVEMVLADAQARLVEWREIERVVPHMDAVVAMAAEAPSDEVVLTADHWRLLVGIAGGQPVSNLLDRFNGSEFEACRKVKELVDAGLATVDTTARVAAPKPKAEAPKPEPKVEEKPEPEPKVEAAKAEPEPKVEDKPEPKSEDEVTGSKISVEKKPLPDADDPLAMLTRPRKVRTQTSTPAAEVSAETNGNGNGNGKKSEPATKTPDEAQALVAQLAALGGADEQELAEKVAAHVAEGGELPSPDEPINRGLLLKFLSSVRN